MRIGAPARRHGVPDEHISHAARNAVRRIRLDDDLTMLSGLTPSVALLEVGALALDGDDRVVIHASPLGQKFWRFLQ